ncbi:hypothetical protein PQX77_019746 [Marasmius sp. AFHP31]|nr:hypothetical protein PQX77_019746 [Marasmius sp. AFHP31]
MPNVRTIEDHFCNLLYKLYKHWPYHEDYSAKLTDRSLIPRIPLDRKREALLGLLLQHFFLSQHISIYWGFVACFDFRQAPIYFYEDNLSEVPRFPYGLYPWSHPRMVDPPPSKLEPKQLTFFQYDPLMAHWVTRPSCHHNPVLHEEFYLDELNRPDSPSVWNYQRDDSELDKYFGWDEVAVHNMWELS